MKLSGRERWIARLALVLTVWGCSDGATRIAYQIESGVEAFRRSEAKTSSIRHVPEATPDGCAGAYTVQFTANSALVILCKTPDGAGEPTIIDLAKEGGRVVVTGVR